ncbi:MAG: glutamyl-tRNA reductase [Planctomycetota bacterium]|nr:MAG: glutamyl-tRNA reductase [Planctomycetota bacterium]
MGLFAVGVNHRSAPIEVREKLSVSPSVLPEMMARLRDFADEGVFVSTCNRVELYISVEGRESAGDMVSRFFAGHSGLDQGDIAGMLYEFSGKDAVRHLFKVVSGIDSMVPGETQILAQVKDAYMQSVAEGMTGPVLNPLFQAAFRTAKLVHTDSRISERKVSVGSVAVDLAESALGGLNDKRVLVIGAGKMSELTLRHLAAKGARSIFVANRTYERALELAEEFRGKAVKFDALDENLAQADIVVASSAAPHYLINSERVCKAMAERDDRPLFLIDIAVPRDVSPEVRALQGVYLYDIDDLQKVVKENLALRESEVKSCLKMVEDAADAYREEAKEGEAAPLIKEITRRLHGIRREEMDRSRAKLSSASDEYTGEVERLTERLVNRILHELLKAVRAEASSRNGLRRGGLTAALCRLFNTPLADGKHVRILERPPHR